MKKPGNGEAQHLFGAYAQKHEVNESYQNGGVSLVGMANLGRAARPSRLWIDPEQRPAGGGRTTLKRPELLKGDEPLTDHDLLSFDSLIRQRQPR